MKSDDFSHYMTAFIMLSRSVLWILKKEYSSTMAFKEWHSAKQVSGRQEKIFKKITELRNQISKVKPLELRAKADFIFDIKQIGNIEGMTDEETIDHLRNKFEGEGGVILTKEEAKKMGAKNEGITLKGKIENVTLEHEAFSDILKECKLYFLILSATILECIVTFGIPSLKLGPAKLDRDITSNW